jgi:hypothetical protein
MHVKNAASLKSSVSIVTGSEGLVMFQMLMLAILLLILTPSSSLEQGCLQGFNQSTTLRCMQ